MQKALIKLNNQIEQKSEVQHLMNEDMKNEQKKEAMWREVAERLKLLGVNAKDREEILKNRSISFKVVRDSWIDSAKKVRLSNKEIEMIKEHEKKYGGVIYYMIKEAIVLMSGYELKRYTMLHVGKNEEEYEMERGWIKNLGTVYAFIVNEDMPQVPQYCEFFFDNVRGLIVNKS